MQTIGPTDKRFDSYEIRAVAAWFDDDTGEEVRETCKEMEDALNVAAHRGGRACWTLYGHLVGDFLEAIADVETEDEARILLYKLTGIIATAGNPGPYMAARQ